MNPKRLIEEWLPIKEVGIESRRERAASSALPPLYFLHVWWARRPLTASRAAILGSLLPAWDGNEMLLTRYFADENEYHGWFLRMLGVLGDPVAAQAKMDAIKNGTYRPRSKQDAKAFTFGRAFRTRLDDSDVEVFHAIVDAFLGTRRPAVLDPMSGGGSIPFEAVRLGLPTVANELNPVACLVLEATLRLPLQFGSTLARGITKWGEIWLDRASRKLEPYYSQPYSEGTTMARVWARTVPCPTTSKPIPLSPNWWLRRQTEDSIALHMLPCKEGWHQCRFEVVRGSQAEIEKKYAPAQGTIRSGNAVSPWSGDPVPGYYIKEAAQSGKMGEQLLAVEVAWGKLRDFNTPHAEEEKSAKLAGDVLADQWDSWIADGLIPTEPINPGNKTAEPRRYGMYRWHELFAPRQLLAMLTYLETLRELEPDMQAELGKEKADAVRTYLAIVLDKCANYNSSLCAWHALRYKIANTFDRHDLSIKWSFAEMNMALKDRGAFPWALKQVVDSYKGLCDLLGDLVPPIKESGQRRLYEQVQVTRANASNLSDLSDASVDSVVVDPPYGANVMYAELSDFFYVWLKRSVEGLHSGWFDSELVDKDAEAVANPARFQESRGGKAKDLAARDYELKMRRIFREMRRVVKSTGSMTVMFTHRDTEMWNALGLALLETGWEIGSSWPVHTESEHSLHIARKNAARSTIILFCRPRVLTQEASYWTRELQDEVRQTAAHTAREFQKGGIAGVDLYLSTFGPVLGVLSRRWPILSEEVDREMVEPLRLEPEEALSIARREVFALQREGLLGGRPANWDRATDWYLLAWKSFGAREFSYDEARKMAMAHGTDADELLKRHKLLSRKGASVTILQPSQREGSNHVSPDALAFPRLIDALHTAMWLYELEGDQGCRRFLQGTGLMTDSDFNSLLRAAINAIPRSRKHSRGEIVGFNVPEAETLENMRISLFPNIEVNEQLDPDIGAEQALMNVW